MSLKDKFKTSTSALESLNRELEKVKKPGGGNAGGDDRFWKPEVDKVGNGQAVIRFLPGPEGEDVPWARLFTHGFQGPGGWYIENSLTTLGKPDPVSEYNSQLWNSGNDADKDIARKQKRRLNYVANVLVVSDPANPANEGKVFLYKFGKKIFDKIASKMQPEFKDEVPMNPFDFWEGANFKLRIRKYEGFPNYDKSEFDSPSALYDGDEKKLEKLWKQTHSLTALLNPENFKSYDELAAQLNKVLNGSSSAKKVDQKKVIEDDMDDTPFEKAVPVKKAAVAKKSAADDEDDEEDQKLMARMKALASED